MNDLYTISSLNETNGCIYASTLLREKHAIFSGHFPGHPVLPGVCMLEMITEITGEYTKQAFRISGAPMIKFLRMIDPSVNPQINLEIKYESLPGGISVDGRIFYVAQVFMKFRMNLVRIKGN
jgi:3-hydroxyacyl-[acyl-carrier-protein] dehydratase